MFGGTGWFSMIGIQMDYSNALPVARGAFPAQRISLPRALVESGASGQNGLVEMRMALSRCDEADRTVAVFMVVPTHQSCDPGARRE